MAQRFKRVDYNYDLISGNVHSVSYQNNQADQWHHAYEYDADNRITDVYTANNNLIALTNGEIATPPMISQSTVHTWDHDASYDYYAHGPLARTEIGDNQVQGSDYVYNLQGWIKGVNSNTLDANRDPGEDGLLASVGGAQGGLNHNFARDVFGYSLNYFEGDYQSINSNNHGLNSFTASIDALSNLNLNRNDLFNGNIGSMVTTITIPNPPISPATEIDQRLRTVKPLGNAYKYDQLNRLLEARSYNNLDLNTNNFGAGGTEMYFNQFTYDANGNIKTQVRNDDQNNPIDNLVYHYADGANGRIQNRLYHVNDISGILPTAQDGDIEDMVNVHPSNTTQSTTFIDNPTDPDDINLYNNYSYTEIGELERDNQEGIDLIIWRVDSKVKEVHRNPSSSMKNLKFDYDAMGNRIAKHVYTTNTDVLEKSTYYLRDAQGNVMSVYEHIVDNAELTVSYNQKEKHIYGSSRIGMLTEEKSMLEEYDEPVEYSRELGLKQYEFSNHLGNVLMVLTDKKIPVESTIIVGEVEYFIGEILSASDYSGFGAPLPGRNFNSSESRYGFNGMEKDDEISGEGNSYTATFWQYDPRLGRRWNNDPVTFPWHSPYACFNNNPIMFSDPDGDVPGEKPVKPFLKIFGHAFYWTRNRKLTGKIIYHTRVINPNIYGGTGDKIIPVDNSIQPAAPTLDDLNTVPRIEPNLKVTTARELMPVPEIKSPITENQNSSNSNSNDSNDPTGDTDHVPGPPPVLKIKFDGGDNSFSNPDEAKKQMEPLIKWLNENPDKGLIVYGNAGFPTGKSKQKMGTGPDVWNQPCLNCNTDFPTQGDLMRARATAIEDYLESQGIKSSRVEVRRGNLYDSTDGRVITTQIKDIKNK